MKLSGVQYCCLHFLADYLHEMFFVAFVLEGLVPGQGIYRPVRVIELQVTLILLYVMWLDFEPLGIVFTIYFDYL